MGSQGFRNIAGNPFVYQEDVRSAAFGLDYTAQKWKIAVSSTTGALPTSTAQITIDPSTDGNIEIVPNGAGLLKIGSASYPKTVAKGDVLVASATNTVGVVAGATTAGYVLTANGAGSAPTFQAAAGGIGTLAGDTGTATGSTITIAGTTNKISTSATSSTVTVSIPDNASLGGTVTAATGFTVTLGNFTATNGNFAITAGLLTLPTTSSTSGYITVNSNRFLHAYGTNGVFLGSTAGNFTLSGTDNVCIGGYVGLALTSGAYNTSVGHASLTACTSGERNAALGRGALNKVTQGTRNTGVGMEAAYKITTGGYNVAVGHQALHQLVSGTYNVGLGADGGYGYGGSESSNICINASGTASESNVLRIGSATGTSDRQLAKAFICGIYGKSVGATNGLVYIDNANQLGSTNSPSVTGSITAGTTLTATSGDITATSGNIVLTDAAKSVSFPSTRTAPLLLMNAQRYLSSANSLYSVYLGYQSGPASPWSGNANIVIGSGSGRSLSPVSGNDSDFNIFVGNGVCDAATTSSFNTAIGHGTGQGLSTGYFNTIISRGSGNNISTGNYNLMMGVGSLNVTGYIYVGAGTNLLSSESNNVLIQADGITGESNVLQIGTATGTGVSQLNKAIIHGIYGKTPGGTINVALIDSNGQLGSTATLSPSLGGAMPWTEVTGTSQSAAVNNGYITNNGSLVTVTLPSTATVGQRVSIVGRGAGLWKLAQNSGQTVHFGSSNTTTGVSGYLAATVRYDCVEVICITANTDWVVRSSAGTITVS